MSNASAENTCRTARRWVLCSLCVWVSALASPTTATAAAAPNAWVIPGGHEPEVLRWLGPLSDGAELTPGWRVVGVGIEQTRIVLTLAQTGGRQWPIALTSPDATAPLQVSGATELPQDVARLLLQRASALPAPGPWTHATSGPRPEPAPPPAVAMPTTALSRAWPPGTPLGAGWHVAATALTPVELSVTATNEGGQSGTFTVRADADCAANAAAPNLHLQLHDLPATLLPGLEAQLAALAGLPTPWRCSTPMVRPALLQLYGRPVLLAVWALLLLVAMRLAVRRLRSHPPLLADLVGSTLLIALAAVVRWFWAPRTLLHEYYHAARSLAFFDFDLPPTPDGAADQALVLAADALTHAGVDGMFASHFVASVLSVPAVMALDARVFGRHKARWLTGLMVALLPMHVRWSACEEVWTLSLLLLAWSLGWWLDWLETPRRDRLLGVVLALAVAARLRPEWLIAPLGFGLIGFAVARPQLATRARRLDLWLAGVALAAWSLVVFAPARTQSVFEPIVRRIWLEYALFNQDMVSAWLVGATILGGFAVWRMGHRKALLALLGANLSLSILELSFFANPGAYLERVQIIPTVMLLPLAARAWLVVPQVKAARWAIAATALLTVGQFVAHHDAMTFEAAPQAEWQFLQTHASAVPATSRLIALSDGQGALSTYPLLRQHRAATLLNPVTFRRSGIWPPVGPDLYVYLGMYCWIVAQDRGPADENGGDICAAIRQHYVLAPVVERVLAPRSYPPNLHLLPVDGGWRIGFYRVVGLQPRANPMVQHAF